MIIGIDGNEANVTKRVGVGEYAYQLLQRFYQVKDIQFVIYLKDKPMNDMPSESENWQYRIIKPGALWTQWRLPLDLYMHKPRPDVFFSPTHYGPRKSPIPTVMTVFDLSYIYFPHLFKKKDLYQLRSWTAYSVKNATKILTISTSSKNDIIEEYGVDKKDVVVTHLGIKNVMSLEPRVYGMNQVKDTYHVSDRYILFVGTLQPRKNIVRLIEAYSKIKKRDFDLVIIGKRGWMYEEILTAPKKYGVQETVKILENVNNDDLAVFYRHALCYVLPSLYEGFGLPVLEAMQYGCPVLTSNISSLPEAGGDAAIYFDPKDVDDIAVKIEKVVYDEKMRKTMIEKGKKHAATFNWDKTAKQTLDILIEVGGKKNGK